MLQMKLPNLPHLSVPRRGNVLTCRQQGISRNTEPFKCGCYRAGSRDPPGLSRKDTDT